LYKNKAGLQNQAQLWRQLSSSSGSGSGTATTTSTTYHTATQTETLSDYQSKHTQPVFESKLPDIAKIPLSEPVPWIPPPKYSTASESNTATRVTTLDNGIRVASEPKFGSFCTVGVVLDSGSRYEVAYPSGISHFLEKLAFGDTLNMKREQIMNTVEKLGGIVDCQTLRDAVIYAASVESKGLERIVELLSEVVWRPLITQPEFEMAQVAVSFDLENLALRPEKDALLMEMIHKAPAGRMKFANNGATRWPNLDWMEAFMVRSPRVPEAIWNEVWEDWSALGKNKPGPAQPPDQVVVWVRGCDHALEERVVDTIESFPRVDRSCHCAGWRPPSIETRRKLVRERSGSCAAEEADLSKVSLGVNPLPELCHLVVGLESVHHQHSDFVTICVLNVLMGGGGSFSAGGPGKGMYTRLYTNVLNKHHWIHNAVAVNHAYSDCGLFCILASAHPSHLHDLTGVLTRELVAMSNAVTTDELQRAKTQLQSMVLMNLESRPVIFEDMARQVLATGNRKQPTYFSELISKVTLDDVHRVAGQMLTSKPSIAAYGSLDKLPSRQDIEAALADKAGRLKSPRSGYSLFR
ncbi:mitochondrial-processing peptidase subunit alpha-like, partial [Hyalella azteca]|uniref:Mitochondrial-processing peptidase subunit alpha-like n=1 Tax=Hyalella azteca TaxID=294128 RepID=A0A8B7NZI6_HYAAZ